MALWAGRKGRCVPLCQWRAACCAGEMRVQPACFSASLLARLCLSLFLHFSNSIHLSFLCHISFRLVLVVVFVFSCFPVHAHASVTRAPLIPRVRWLTGETRCVGPQQSIIRSFNPATGPALSSKQRAALSRLGAPLLIPHAAARASQSQAAARAQLARWGRPLSDRPPRLPPACLTSLSRLFAPIPSNPISRRF